MIPNLSDLPPFPEEEKPWKKLIRPLLTFCFALLVAGGLWWLYEVGVHKLAREETSVLAGLEGVARDLWMEGTAPEIRVMDPELAAELARLRQRPDLLPSVVVTAADASLVGGNASHELIYLQGKRHILGIRVFLDQGEGKVDILSYRTGPEFKAPEASTR